MRTADEQSGPAGAQYVITLVHGTWAKNAPWVGPESALSKALQERFGERTKVFPFEWAGGNSHTARRQASNDLRNKLALRLEKHGGARHYLICHSHGGDVALRALAGSGFQAKIAGVVCLATPFLVARERDLGRNPLKHLAGALVVVMFLTMWLMDRLLLPGSWPALVRFVVLAVVTSIVMGALSVLATKWREYARRLRSDFESVTVEPDRLLIIRSPGDEASGALAFFQFISQLSVRMYIRTFSLYELLEAAANRWAKQKRKMLAAAAGAFVAFLGFVFVAVSLPWETGFESWINVAAIVATFVSLLISMGALYLVLGWVEHTTIFFRLAASAVVWPVIVLLSFLLLPFGWEVALGNILLDVTAETTPLGSWTVHLMEPPTSKELGKDVLPLMHSVVYENPRVLKFVCDWIASGDRAAIKGDGVA